MATAKTVLGEVPAKQLGRALCHEHLILAPSAAKDDEPDTYNVESLASKITSNASSAIQAHSIKTLVDVTPWTLGRDIELQQMVAKRLGINVIAATGFYQQQVGIPAYWHYQEEGQYEELMLRELIEG
ncbi:MAG: hypothetical protein HYY31_05885, partial [Chloroflexi bacterium]|nr:hypothetical protein [Chloroflexota bacterium]